MSSTITLTLPYPPSANRYWRSAPKKGLVPSKEATEYKDLVRMIAGCPQPLLGDCRVALIAFRPRAAGDLDNVLKVLFDALKGVAFLDDDQVVQLSAQRRDDPERPRVELIVEGESVATPAQVAAHRERLRETNRKRKETLARNRTLKTQPLAQPAVYRPKVEAACHCPPDEPCTCQEARRA